MATTYEPIATTTLGSAVADITFSSIASSWTDLKLVVVLTVSSSAYTKGILNNDTAANYSSTVLKGDGSSVSASLDSNGNYIFAGFMPSTTVPNTITYDFFNYAGSTYKTCLVTSSYDLNGSGGVARSVSYWRNTAAITSIKLNGNGGNFNIGTTATLYGILKA